ncbi:bifunctional diaminohydroxyphosphoribosylaminopyrimidine deaminase/5-amino-6-(5-phosphoribosylamino)uracil reductase RibD [Candidatus Peregrinibacteria bacterium]|nr:bifunctional diaminohydroxyphosphoribosylaminopyrimidine deaminase/5-amino-6-(5-phosphoribosylamino)uracil reductase RibD [Candidatus Peregrinibacteria bacterium]
MNHYLFMRRCLELAERGRGSIGNGALVGSLLVREGKIIAEDHYSGFGNFHAERALVEKFDPTPSASGGLRGASQKIAQEDVLYVNLEPCCHEGKTPPCTNYLIEKGVKHVVFGMIDPDPRVSGKGIMQLREAGVEVIGPVVRAQCEWLNRGFISLRKKNRPWITLKMARTLSGEIASPDGSPKKITSKDQDVWVHERVRGESDAVLVGVGTVIADNPFLTIRNTIKKFVRPYRIILDAQLNTPVTSHVVTDEHTSRTILVADPKNASGPKARDLAQKGAHIFPVAMKDGQFVWSELWKMLTEPKGDFHGIASILVEGGRRTWDIFKEAGMVDEEIILIGS